MPIRVFLVDDADEMIEAMGIVYGAHPDVNIVGSAFNSDETLQALRQEHANVDIISIDIRLGRESGIELCRKITSEFPGVFVVMCSLESDSDARILAREAGASYFLSKPFGMPEITSLIAAYHVKKAKQEQGDGGSNRTSDGAGFDSVWINTTFKQFYAK